MLKKLIPQNAFARGVTVLVSGNAGAQALMVLAAPLLTRLYTPEDFGLLAVYAGLLALFSVVASLRYELAIPLPESQYEAANVVILSLLIVLVMTAISGLMVLIAGGQIALALDTPKLAKYFWLLPVGVFLSGVYKVFNYWAVRERAFSDIAITRISQTLVSLAIQILGFKIGGLALLLGQACGQGVGTFRLLNVALKHNVFKSLSFREVWSAAKKYQSFPLFSTWSGVFNTAGTQLPSLMLAAFFSASGAGFYALAHRVLVLPMNVMGNAIGKVFLSRAPDASRKGQLPELVENVHSYLAKIAMPVSIVIILIGPDLFSYIFSEDWRKAGVFAQLLAPFLYIQFITSPLSTLHSILGHQAKGAFFHGVLLVVRALSISIGFWNGDVFLAITLFSLGSALCWFCFLYWILYLSGVSPIQVIMSSLFKAAWLPLLAMLPMLLSVLLNWSDNHLIISLLFYLSVVSVNYAYMFRTSW